MQENHQITPFFFRDQAVRTILKDGEPWFVAKDVCDVLEIQNVTQALETLDPDELTYVKHRSGGQHREMNAVSESGLYALIFKSRKPEAKAFRKWVTSEVLPTLRKTGRYETPKYRRESGLNIRYTLDLTKVALNPTPRTLDLVQRLTGVDLEDIVEEMEAHQTEQRGSGQEAFFTAWLQEALVIDPCYKTTSRELYAIMKDHWQTTMRENRRAIMPSHHAMSRWLFQRGFVRRRIHGVPTFYGIGPA